MRQFFKDLAIFLNMNIYIPWNDIEAEVLDWTFFVLGALMIKEQELFLMQRNLVILVKLVIWIIFLISSSGYISRYKM